MDLQTQIDLLGPWHYSHLIKGHRTGDSPPDALHDKLRQLIDSGFFPRPAYANVLDLGANSGLISEWFVHNKHSKVDAIEYGPKYYKQLEFVVEHKELGEWVTPMQSDVTSMVWDFAKYDLVLFLGTLHHLGGKFHQDVIDNCHFTLVPGGDLVVQTRPDIDVPGLLKKAGFINIKEAGKTNWIDRKAWIATKDPMKIV